jgi:mono/diheme cytochrome c family protein
MRAWSALFVAVVVGCGGGKDTASDTASGTSATGHPALALQGDVAEGANVYSATCANCHGADGEGGIGPELGGLVQMFSDAQIIEIVEGGSGQMAPLDLADQELADVVAYLDDLFR